jgi:hypothetical protein
MNTNKPNKLEISSGISTKIAPPAGDPKKIETKSHVIHLEPRISAAKLAEYIVTDPARQKTIAKESKKARKVMMVHYAPLRSALQNSIANGGLNAEKFLERAEELRSSAAIEPWQVPYNKHNAEALESLASLAPMIELPGAQQISRPKEGWGHIMIKGVRVSVNPELVFSIPHRGLTKVGAVILNTGQHEKFSLSRKASTRYSVGDYLTALVYIMLQTRLGAVGTPLHTKCLAVDVFRNEIYTAPQSFKTLLKHIEAACEMIALRWNTIPVDLESLDDEEGNP